MKETKMKRVPKLRFPEFTDDWEQRKLLNCVQKVIDFRGRTPKKLGMEWSDRGYLALSALNVKDGYIDFDQDVHYGDKTLYDKWMTGNELHQGQVLFTTEGLGWTRNGAAAGTAGYAKRLEAIQIVLVQKNEATLKSVERQTFTDYEYLIVDGASTDGTVAIAQHSAAVSSVTSEDRKSVV